MTVSSSSAKDMSSKLDARLLRLRWCALVEEERGGGGSVLLPLSLVTARYLDSTVTLLGLDEEKIDAADEEAPSELFLGSSLTGRSLVAVLLRDSCAEGEEGFDRQA